MPFQERMSSADSNLMVRSKQLVRKRHMIKRNQLEVIWLPGPSPVGRSACRSLAQNPEHQSHGGSSARSRKVAWSCRPLAAVQSGKGIRRIRPARSPLQVLRPPAESSAASAAPGRPVVHGKVLRYRQLGGGSLLPPARSPVERSRRMRRRCPCSSSPAGP
jgi:hypothetical protein